VRRVLAAALLGWLAGCGGGAPPPQAPTDQALFRAERTARLAFDQRQLDQAAVLTREALDKAYARDDLSAIADLGYNLAVIELRRGRSPEAVQIARATAAEIARRGQAPFEALRLAEAMALYRSGEASAAGELARALTQSTQGEIAARAQFLRGLIGADQGDEPALASAIVALGSGSGEARADRDELVGRRAKAAGDAVAARQAFLAAADLRRELLDYAGMARVLALAAETAAAAGQATEAADLYLRAGRSAAIQGAKADARRWLTEAERLGGPDIAADARARLAALER